LLQDFKLISNQENLIHKTTAMKTCSIGIN